MNGSPHYYWSDCYEDGAIGRRPPAGILILFAVFCLEFLVGLPLNLWLICHILRKRSKDVGVLPADFFPLHLALSHLLFYLVLPTMFINHYMWESDNVMFLLLFMTSMVVILKPLLLCMVCVERYVAVVRPFLFLRLKAPKYRWGYLGVSWFIYLLMVSTIGQSLLAVSLLFIPVLIIDTFCCLSVLKLLLKPPPGDNKTPAKREVEKRKKSSLRMEEKKGEKGETDKPRDKGEMNSTKKKAFFTIAIIQAVLIFNYLPVIVMLPLEKVLPVHVVKCQFSAISFAAAASCSYLQPLLYLHRLGWLPCATARS